MGTSSTTRPRSGASHPQAAGAGYFFLDFEDVPAAGSRPDRLAGVRPQERVLRRTVQQIVDPVPSLPTLVDPAPQMVEQLLDIMHFFDTLTPDPEQVIEVPKIFSDDVPFASRSWRNSWWNSLWKCLRSYPFPRCSGLWSRTWPLQILVVEGDSQVLKVYFPDRVQQRRLPRRSLTFPMEVFKTFAQERIRQRHLLFSLQLVRMMTRVSLVKGFFALFPKIKKCEVGFALESEGARQCQLIHAERSSNGSGQFIRASEP